MHGKENSSSQSIPDAGRPRGARSTEPKRESGTRRVDSVEAKTVPSGSQAYHRTGFAQTPKQNEYAFINLPFHEKYETTLLALISGLTAFGLVPQLVTLEPRSEHRLQKLIRMIRRSTCSFHDLSYVLRDGQRGVPRFNIPFELGLAVGLAGKPTWFVLERRRYRLLESLSDLNGVDPLIYHGTVRGIHQALLKVFDRKGSKVSIDLLMLAYHQLRQYYPGLRQQYGPAFNGPCFRRLRYLAAAVLANETDRRF